MASLFVESDPTIFFLNGVQYSVGKIVHKSLYVHGNWNYIRVLDIRDYSDTYVVKSPDSIKYVLKFIKESEATQENILNEIELQITASNVRVSPRIILAFLFEKGAIVIMEKLSQNLGDFLTVGHVESSIYDTLIMDIMAIVSRLHSIGIAHGDFSISNIMVNDEKTPTLYAIDFGQGSSHENESVPKKLMIEDFETLLGSFRDLYSDFQQFRHIAVMHNMILRFIERRFR